MKLAPDSKSFQLTWDLPHKPEKVWRALTESDLLAKWVMPNDLKPVVGFAFTFRQTPTPYWDGIVNGEVLAVEPLKRLAYSWKGVRQSDGTYKVNTIVTWTLVPTPTGTLLQLEQAGFTVENGPAAFAGAKSGWSGMVKNLINLLAE